MNYWLCITNEENWNVVNEMNIWGASERGRNQLNRVEIGDILILYLKQEKVNDEIRTSRISGIFKVVTKPFWDDKRIFTYRFKDETFPYRVRLEPMIIPKEPIEFKPLVQSLNFITNKKKWSAFLQTAMRTIPKGDFERIRKRIEERAYS